MNTSEFESRLRIVLFLFIFTFGSLWIRLFYIQVVRGDSFRNAAEANRTTVLFERAPRGLILDRNGAVLADSRPTFVVLFTPLNLRKDLFKGVIHRLAGILDEDEEKLRRRLEPAIQHSSLVRVMERAPRSVAFALAEQRPNLPGVSVVTEMQRRYPNGALASHVLGYLGQITSAEFQRLRQEGYQSDWLVGKMGMEKTYDEILRGKSGGTRIEVDAAGRSLKVLDRMVPSAGYQITTTLDLQVQKAAEDALALQGKPGAVVAMDPRNGEILAYASAPSFDPNIFLYGHGEQTEGETPGDLLRDEDLPLFNRPVQGQYPPGSIFKIVTTAAILESGRISPDDRVFCPGFYMMGGAAGRKFLCWKKPGHGSVDLMDAVMNSCDVYFYQTGLRVGPDAIERMAHNFGLGRTTGVEFSGERKGLVPGRGMFKTGVRHWYDGDTLNMAIGQGTILLTPMQAAEMVSVVANRGKLFRPRLVREIRSPRNDLSAVSAPDLLGQFELSGRDWDFLDDALSRVVEKGTGQACKIPGLRVGGKTGTAQNPQGKDHAWFVAYAPVGDPKVAVAVLVEHGVHGATAAAPVAQKVILAALRGQLTPAQQAAPVGQIVGD